ncbi:MAG: hypothetical protein PVI86_07585 [Phycisphaerae bacterium]|jgi:hypothetical protein
MSARAGTFAWVFVVAVLTLPVSTLARRGGPPQGVNGSIASGGDSCLMCHISLLGSGSLDIIGAPTAYAINETYDLTVRITDPVQAGAGFQISVEDSVGQHVGTLLLTDPVNTQFNTGDANWVNHTETGVDNAVADWAAMGDAAEYHLQWQAPAYNAGALTFWAAGNAINNDFSSSGDRIYLTSETAAFDVTSVPTVSQWGLTALTIAVLCAGTVVVRRRAMVA